MSIPNPNQLEMIRDLQDTLSRMRASLRETRRAFNAQDLQILRHLELGPTLWEMSMMHNDLIETQKFQNREEGLSRRR